MWTILAETITQRRPLPLPSFRSRDSLSLTDLETAVCEAARLERNWLSSYARLRRPPKVLHEPTRRLGDPVVLLPGGRFIVTGAASGRGGGGTGGIIRVWDLSDGNLVGSFEVRPEDTVLQWRPVDEGRAVMFMIRDGILTELVRSFTCMLSIFLNHHLKLKRCGTALSFTKTRVLPA